MHPIPGEADSNNHLITDEARISQMAGLSSSKIFKNASAEQKILRQSGFGKSRPVSKIDCGDQQVSETQGAPESVETKDNLAHPVFGKKRLYCRGTNASSPETGKRYVPKRCRPEGKARG